jgi:hypothetical protein
LDRLEYQPTYRTMLIGLACTSVHAGHWSIKERFHCGHD